MKTISDFKIHFKIALEVLPNTKTIYNYLFRNVY